VAASYSCDGCGVKIDEPLIVGHIVKRDYCEACARKAEAFLEAEELLRANASHQFVTARAALIATAAIDGFKLPDVP
jgi:hypothetical protein